MNEQLGLIIFESDIHTDKPKYEVLVAKGSRSDKLFLTSPNIRNLITKNNLKSGTVMGNISFMLHNENLIYDWHYPIGKQFTKINNIFSGTETARYIEQKAIDHLKKHRTIKTIKHNNPQPPRIAQLGRIGFKIKQIEKGIPFTKFRQKLRDNLAKSLSKRRRR